MSLNYTAIMDNITETMNELEGEQIADRVAKGVVARSGLTNRVKQAQSFFDSGIERGSELGIREIEMLARESEKLAKKLRRIQNFIPSWEVDNQQAKLREALEEAL